QEDVRSEEFLHLASIGACLSSLEKMGMEMHQLLYVSQAARNIPASDLDDILAAGRANNLARGLSGVLIHIDGGFLQILEGERDAVMQTYGRIAGDRRHAHPRVLVDRTVPHRSFPDW